jgi:hypothetical protein
MRFSIKLLEVSHGFNQYSTVDHSAARHCGIQHDVIHYSALQFIPVLDSKKHSSVQPSTAEHCIAQRLTSVS